MDLNARYVVVSAETGRVHWHGDLEGLREQARDAADLEKMRGHLDRVTKDQPGAGALVLRQVTPCRYRQLLLQASAAVLQGEDWTALSVSDPN